MKRKYNNLVLGTAAIGGAWGQVDERESIDTLLFALGEGIQHLDTSPSYSKAEEYIGKALKEWKGERPIISTKCGRLKSEAADVAYYDYSDENITRSVHESLEIMGLAQLDILFLHDPTNVPTWEISRVIACLHRIKEDGLAKQIGLGGNYGAEFSPFVKKENFDIVMEYNRLNACTLEALEDSVPLYEQEQITHYVASPLNMGLLARRLDEFKQNKPEWIAQSSVDNAVKVKAYAEELGIPLPSLAHRYLLGLDKYADKIVIGPKKMSQLQATMNDWQLGALPSEQMNHITQLINTKLYAAKSNS